MSSHVILAASLFVALSFPVFARAQTYDMTRADFVRLVMEEKGIPSYGGARCFTDVTDQAFAPSVCAAKQRGIITGDPSGRFRPNDDILFIEAAAIVVRAEGATVPFDPLWYVPYLRQVGDWNAFPSRINNIFDRVPRDQAVEMLQRIRNRERNTVVRNGEIVLSLTVSDSTPEPGDRVTFRIHIDNPGTEDLRDIDITATLDNDMEYISSSDDGDEDDGEVEWEEIRVDEGEGRTILLTVEIDDDADEGDTLRLSVRADGKSVAKTVRVVEEDDDDDDEDVQISISDSSDPVEAGDTVSYKITLENRDNERVRLTVRAYLDEDMHFVSASDDGERSGDTIVWDRVTLDEDEEDTLTLRVRIDEDARDGDRVMLHVDAGGEDDTEWTDIEDGNSTGSEDVRIRITDSPDPVGSGELLTYRIGIENLDDRDIRVDAEAFLDEDVRFMNGSHNPVMRDIDEIHWDDLRIDEDEEIELLLTVRVVDDVLINDMLRLRVRAGNDEDEEFTDID